MPSGVTTTDDFLGGRVSAVQPKRGHRAGSDAVFLAAAVAARKGDRVLDAGAGVGVAGLCLSARVPGLDLTAVEIDTKLCTLAADNAQRNRFERFRVVNADVTSTGKALRAAGLESESYDRVIANPPFYAEGRVRPAPDRARRAAHVMENGGLKDWVRFFAAMAAPKGTLTLIHRPDCLRELLQLLEGRFGEVVVFPLYPKPNEPAVRIIVQARKGSRGPMQLKQGLVLHDEDGRYTDAAEAVLRSAAALDLGLSRKGKGRRPGGKSGSPL